MKSLRADLAAAAREARDESRAASRTVRSDLRDSSNGLLRDAEIALNDFRHQLRTDLRSMAARDELTPELVGELKQQLDGMRTSFFRID